MAKLKRKISLDVFGIAFLDVISCAFGAAVLLLIFSKDAAVSGGEPEDYASILMEKILLENKIKHHDEMISSAVSQINELNKELQSVTSNGDDDFYSLKNKLIEIKNKNTSLAELLTVPSPLVPPKNPLLKYNAGIPSGSENIIFIIDTSGSMKRYWPVVVNTISEILNIHQSVKQIQIMSDQGETLFSHMGNWIRDSKTNRKLIMSSLPNWQAISSSNPAKALQITLQRYAKIDFPLSIYVLGDDFTGQSYDEVLNIIEKYNVSKISKLRKASIHGIGFPWGLGDRFPTLMREVANNNNGVFIGL